MNKISVVFPCYITTDRQLKMTMTALELMRERTSVPFELVIVETCSQHLKDEADVYVYEKTKTKANTSINRGFSVANGNYVVFFSNDVYVGDGWLEAMLECFKQKEDCGLSTVGTTQLKHKQCDLIVEGIYFPIAMIPKEEAWFDPWFNNCWDDTDLIMRVYSKGKKMYQNLNSICEHLDRQTQEAHDKIIDHYKGCREYFVNKWKDYSATPIFKQLAGN